MNIAEIKAIFEALLAIKNPEFPNSDEEYVTLPNPNCAGKIMRIGME